jgi:hypothetical protein
MTLPLLEIGLISKGTKAMFVLVEKNKQKVHVDDLISLQLSGQRFI